MRCDPHPTCNELTDLELLVIVNVTPAPGHPHKRVVPFRLTSPNGKQHAQTPSEKGITKSISVTYQGVCCFHNDRSVARHVVIALAQDFGATRRQSERLNIINSHTSGRRLPAARRLLTPHNPVAERAENHESDVVPGGLRLFDLSSSGPCRRDVLKFAE